MQNNSKEFKDLKSEWYERLKNEGFSDIERDEERLKIYTTSKMNVLLYGNNKAHKNYDPRTTADKIEMREDYYRLAGFFLFDHQFKTPRERTIWELHSEGISHRDIVVKLKDQGIKSCRTYVLNTIDRLKKQMIKLYGTGI